MFAFHYLKVKITYLLLLSNGKFHSIPVSDPIGIGQQNFDLNLSFQDKTNYY